MENINFADFVRQIAKKTGYPQKNIKEVLSVASDIALDDIKEGKSVNVFNGVKFEPLYVAQTRRLNPQTGAQILIPAHHKPKAKFGKRYKEALK